MSKVHLRRTELLPDGGKMVWFVHERRPWCGGADAPSNMTETLSLVTCKRCIKKADTLRPEVHMRGEARAALAETEEKSNA